MMRRSVFKMSFGAALLLLVGALFAFYACVPIDTDGTCNETLKPGDNLKCSVGGREYYLYAPANYNPGEQAALVVDAHGAAESAAAHAGIGDEYCTPEVPGLSLSSGSLCFPALGAGWREEAETDGGGFIVITPQGRMDAWTPSDEGFIIDAVAHVKSIANIDPDKVYMSGISNGGLLSYWVGCPNTDVFSGLAPISGGANCRRVDKAIPVITFDAELDFAYATAVSASDKMVNLNNCNNTPTTWLTVDSNYDEAVCWDNPYAGNRKLVPCSSITPAIAPTVCKRWYDCDRGTEVVFCEVVPGNSHGPENAVVDAHVLYFNDTHLNLPSLAWRFFKSMPDGGEGNVDQDPWGCR